jgi:hypothetical protein
MCSNNARPQDYLSSYYVNGARKDVTAEDISKHLNLAAGLLNYPTHKGIPVERVDTHSLRGGGANALALSGYSETAIQKMGRWKGATFKEYIREELANYADGMSTAMKTKFNFMNVAGNAFRDITETVLTMEYNTEFNTAGAAKITLAGTRLAVTRRPLDDADDSSAEIGCHLGNHWGISVRITWGEIGLSTSHLLYRAKASG